MVAKPTRTLNPLPFHDLEPHRFEDLVRQLAYDLRRWKTIEPTGRGGADDGMDIRAIELTEDDAPRDTGDTEDTFVPVPRERMWIFQCKREKEITPKAVRAIVAESLPSGLPAPHGFVLAAACDFTKKSHDAFREEMVARRVEEFFLWGRSALEDMLFRPQNDRLLFAYFGISLQPRRRSLATAIRSRAALKKQLRGLLEGEDKRGAFVLLRDPTDERYPARQELSASESPKRWLVCAYAHLRNPDHLAVIWREHLAWLALDGKGWDALFDYDVQALRATSHLRAEDAWLSDADRNARTPHREFWDEYVPDPEKAWLKIMRLVPLDRVLGVDALGDGYYPVPHIFVEFEGRDGPFGFSGAQWLEHRGGHRAARQPTEDTRVQLFPQPLPAKLFPPPPGFEASLRATPHILTPDGAARLEKFLSSVETRRDSHAESRTGSVDRLAEADARLGPFRTWRDGIAVPVFSAVVERLRRADHDARVAVRSVPPGATANEASESVEIRLAVRVGGLANPDYRSTGHVRVSLAMHGSLSIDVSPSPDSSAARYTPEVRPQLADLTAERLEQEVAQVLERVAKRW